MGNIEISKKYVLSKLALLLGGKESLENNQKGDWSPNNIKMLFIGKNKIEVSYHLETSKEIKSYSLTEEFLEGFNSGSEEGVFTFEELSKVLGERSFQNLEGVFYTEPWAESIERYFIETNRDKRLWSGGRVRNDVKEIEEIDPENYSLVGEGGILEGKNWKEKIGTNSAYPLDTKIRRELEKILEEEDDELDLFGEEDEGEEDSDEEAKEFFKPVVSGTVNQILESYNLLFASGYELFKPEGMLARTPDGNYRMLSINEDNKLKIGKADIFIKSLGETFFKRMGLEVREERATIDIANVLTKASRRGGNTALFFPYKLLEYAYGRKHRLVEKEEGRGTYEPHSESANWYGYVESEVRPSLMDLVSNIFINSLKSEGLIEDYEGDEAGKVVTNIRKTTIKALTSCILVSSYDGKGGNPSKIKVRVVDSYGKLDGVTQNLVTESIKNAVVYAGGEKGYSIPTVKKGNFYEYSHELDHVLANAEPLFAPKALYALRAKGEKVSWNNLILGKKNDDTILKACKDPSEGISFNSALTHFTTAGSRAGKGVMTMNVLAAVIQSKRALFYLDDKPDVGSILKHLGPEGFFLNGSSNKHDPASGYDYYKEFVNEDQWIRPDRAPSYLFPGVFGESSQREVGKYIYLRGMLFTLGILLARVKSRINIGELGGEKGIVIVYDELENATAEFNAWLEAMKGSGYIANKRYADEFSRFQKETEEFEQNIKEWEQGGSVGPKPRVPKRIEVPTVDKPAYWFTSVYEAVKETIFELNIESRAGLKNIEAGCSDIFILTQNLPQIASNDNTDSLFFTRNLTTNSPSNMPANKNILASMASMGGSDGFLGYSNNQQNILGQQNPGTIAADKLDPYARNFAYVKSITTNNWEKIVNGDRGTAESATYFKPFLLLIEGNEPFTVKAQEYAQNAGVDWEQVVRRNEKNPGDGFLDPAVGFKGYLNEMGLSDSNIAEILGESGQIAQGVVDRLGYEGSWKEFIYDLRPEWIFSAKDISDAFSGKPLKGKYRKYISEFLTVYPEEFPNIQNVDVRGGGNAGEDGGLSSGGYQDLTADNWESGWNQENYPGQGGFESIGQDPDLGQGLDQETREIPNAFQDVLNPAVTDLEDSKNTLDLLTEEQLNPTYQQEEIQGRESWNNLGTVELQPGSVSLDVLKSMVTNAVIKKIPLNQIKTLSVVGGSLLVNRSPVSVNFGSNVLNAVEPVYANRLMSGMIADLFTWGYLDEMSGLESLKVDSKNFMRGTILPQIGLNPGRDFGISNLFGLCGGLKKITLSGNVYTRDNYKEKTASSGFVQSIRDSVQLERTAFLFTRGLGSGTKKTFSWGLGRFRSGRRLSGALGMAGGAVLGTATVASGIGGAVVEGGKLFKKALSEVFFD